ncbi:MPN domain-containing protein [Plasmodiophora brassicae]
MIVRVQGASGLKRIQLPGGVTSTWDDLLRQTALKFDMPLGKFRLSRRPLHDPEVLSVDPSTPLGSISIVHGTMLYLSPDPDIVAASNQKPSFKLTPECQHGPKGRCLHCLSKPAADAPLASWLCTHPPTAFCPKCLPPEEPSPESAAPATNDIDPSKPLKVDIIPYAQFMKERRAICGYKHSASTVCPNCAPPPKLEYSGKSKCDRGHRPWPHGVCGKCAPPNAVLHLQKYRHCDGISFKNTAAGEKFIAGWNANPGLQQAAILFGRFIDEPTTTGNFGAIRAEVECLYKPPQESLPDGVNLLRDTQEANVLKVVAELGLEPVGWAITTLPRGGKEYGGDVFLSGREVRQAARFQLKFGSNAELGHSRFVTMVIQHNEQGNIEPKAYQISDQGVALERDGLIEEGSSIGFIRPKMPKKGDLLASIIYKNRMLKPGEDLLPDELLVKVIPMQPFNPQPMFKYQHFPFDGTDVHVAAHLQRHAREPIHVKFSDFLLLLYLPRIMDWKLVREIIHAVKTGVSPEPSVVTQIEYALKAYT